MRARQHQTVWVIEQEQRGKWDVMPRGVFDNATSPRAFLKIPRRRSLFDEVEHQGVKFRVRKYVPEKA